MTDIAEIRRANLRLIIKRDGLSSAAKRFGKPDRQINDMAAKRKSFGEKVARDMERAYDPSRPSGWLDIPSDADRDAGHAAGSAISPSSDADNDKISANSDGAAESSGKQARDVLWQRYQSADAATRMLIELALSEPTAPMPSGLSPSVKSLIASVRTMLAEQMGRTQKDR